MEKISLYKLISSIHGRILTHHPNFFVQGVVFAYQDLWNHEREQSNRPIICFIVAYSIPCINQSFRQCKKQHKKFWSIMRCWNILSENFRKMFHAFGICYLLFVILFLNLLFSHWMRIAFIKSQIPLICFSVYSAENRVKERKSKKLILFSCFTLFWIIISFFIENRNPIPI